MPSYLGSGIEFPVVWAGQVRATGIAFPVVGFIIAMLRLNARRWQRTRIGADDIFGLIAWVTLAVMGACFVYGANHRTFGWRAPPKDKSYTHEITDPDSRTILTRDFERLQYVWQIFMILTYGFTKLSIIWFCRRIFVAHRRTTLDVLTLGLTGLVVIWTVSFSFAYVFYCKGHPSAFWSTPRMQKKYCLPLGGAGHELQYSMAITDMLLDVCCVSIPFPVIWRLQLTVPQKSSITGIFLIGLLTVGASIARIVAYFQIDATASHPKEDLFLGTTIALYWSMLEAGLAYIASQLPALSQYLTRFSARDLGSSLSNVIAWASHSRLGSPRRSDNDVSAGNGQFHELRDKHHSSRPSDATDRTNSHEPGSVKARDSQKSLISQ